MRRLMILLCLLVLPGCGEEPGSPQPPAPDPVAALSPALRSEFPEERDAALKALAEFGSDGAAAVPDLLFLMRGADESVREPAEQVLLSMGEAAIPGLLAALRADDWQERAPAVRCLVGSGPAAREQVLALLDDPLLRAGAIDYLLLDDSAEGVAPRDLEGALSAEDAELRRNALAVLMKIEGSWVEILPRLKALADDPDQEVILRVIKALEKHRDALPAESVEALMIGWFEHGDSWVRYQAVYAAGSIWRIPPPAVLAALILAAGDPDQSVRGVALQAISRSGANRPEYLELLLKGLADEDVRVRTACARAIAPYREKAAAAVPALIQALELEAEGGAYEIGSVETLKRAAMDTLASIGPSAKAAGPALIDLLSHEDDRVTGDAARVLAVLEVEMTLEQQLLALRRLQGSWAEEEYFLELLVPTAIRDPEVMAAMLEILSEPRRSATLPRFVRKLLNVGDAADPVVPVVVKSLSETPTMPVSLAAKFLKGREQAAVPLLRQALSGADPAGRLRVLQVLYLLKADEGAFITALRAALGSKDPEMRCFAVDIAGSAGSDLKALVPELIPLLRDEDDGVFAETIFALNAMGAAAKSAVPVLLEIAKTSDSEWRRELAAEWALLFSQR